MSAVEFIELTCNEVEQEQRVEIAVCVAAADVDRESETFFKLMARARGLEADDADKARVSLEELVGKNDLREAQRDFLLNRFTMAAVQRVGYDYVLMPGVHAEDLPHKGEDFSFAINLTLRPTLTLSSVDPVRVVRKSVRVEEADIQAQLDYTASQFATFVRVEDRPLVEGDFAVMDVDMLRNGRPDRELSGSRRRINLSAGEVPADFLNGVLGMVPGDIRKLAFSVETLSTDSATGFKTDDYKADVMLREVNAKQLPVIDDAWVAENLPQYGTLDGFREAIRADLAGQATKVEQQDFVYQVRHALEQRLVGTIPDEMYQSAKDSLMEQTTRKLGERGITLDQYCQEHEITKDAFNMNLFMQASEVLRQNLALDVLARERGFDADESEIAEAKARLTPAVAALSDEEFARRGFAQKLAEQLRREKALQWLLETAVAE